MAGSTAGKCALTRATRHLGETEQPPGSNRSPLIDSWNQAAGLALGQPWCMSFATAMFKACGVQLGGHGGVERFEVWAKANHWTVTGPAKGDLVCFDWDGAGWADHVGIVERVLAVRYTRRRFVGLIQTIEGNAGNAVSRRRRWVGSAVFVRGPNGD